MSLSAGTRRGPYEIVPALGAAGMGQLNRGVAIKVLLDAVAPDPERIARFAREAKTLAALNHPNIGGIHGLEDANGVTGLVLDGFGASSPATPRHSTFCRTAGSWESERWARIETDTDRRKFRSCRTGSRS